MKAHNLLVLMVFSWLSVNCASNTIKRLPKKHWRKLQPVLIEVNSTDQARKAHAKNEFNIDHFNAILKDRAEKNLKWREGEKVIFKIQVKDLDLSQISNPLNSYVEAEIHLKIYSTDAVLLGEYKYYSSTRNAISVKAYRLDHLLSVASLAVDVVSTLTKSKVEESNKLVDDLVMQIMRQQGPYDVDERVYPGP